jgi:hypothetical protein
MDSITFAMVVIVFIGIIALALFLYVGLYFFNLIIDGLILLTKSLLRLSWTLIKFPLKRLEEYISRRRVKKIGEHNYRVALELEKEKKRTGKAYAELIDGKLKKIDHAQRKGS